MNIFVKSRGHEQHEDYQWHHAVDEREEVIHTLIPAPYERYTLGRMISTEGESYVIGRFEGKLALLITSVLSASRGDFIGRPVRDSLLWVGSYADESVLRGIIARALRDARWLPTLLDQAISFDEKQRFKVQHDVFIAALHQNDVASAPPNPTPLIRRLSETSRRELGDELHGTRLPTTQGLLVVVTTIQSLQTMADAGIWRGLAQGIRSEHDWDMRTTSRYRAR